MWILAGERLVNMSKAIAVDIEPDGDRTSYSVVAKFPTTIVVLVPAATKSDCLDYLGNLLAGLEA